MMTSAPVVTIAIPTRNRGALLKRALESAINQSYPKIEIVVSDNNSTDETPQILNEFSGSGVIILRQRETVPMMENWNACLERASGEYFLLLSDDDVLEREAVSALLIPFCCDQVFEGVTADEIGVVMGRVAVVRSDERIVGWTKIGRRPEEALCAIRKFFLGARSNYPCGNLVRRSDIVLAGRYDGETYSVGADGAVWMLAVLRRGYVAYVPERVARYRQHSGNATTAVTIDEWRKASQALENVLCRQASQCDSGLRTAILRHRTRMCAGLSFAHARRSQRPSLQPMRPS